MHTCTLFTFYSGNTALTPNTFMLVVPCQHYNGLLYHRLLLTTSYFIEGELIWWLIWKPIRTMMEQNELSPTWSAASWFQGVGVVLSAAWVHFFFNLILFFPLTFDSALFFPPQFIHVHTVIIPLSQFCFRPIGVWQHHIHKRAITAKHIRWEWHDMNEDGWGWKAAMAKQDGKMKKKEWRQRREEWDFSETSTQFSVWWDTSAVQV